jgi:hypothetical protein
MEWVDTSLGRVPVWGAFESSRPLVLGIRGAFGAFGQLADLDPPGSDLALLHLPGMHSPPLAATSIGAFDQVIRTRFAGRDITVVGLSVGAIVALGRKAPEVKAVLAVEPFFSTAGLWPLIEYVQRDLRQDVGGDPEVAFSWARNLLGIGQSEVEDRDFSPVLTRTDRPSLAIFGRDPLLPRRPYRGMPSLAGEEDRARLPYIVVDGGHGIGSAVILEALGSLKT